MKYLIIFIAFLISGLGLAQEANEYFVASANHYINSQNEQALSTVKEGLSKFPEDKKLQELKKRIEDQKNNDEKEGDNKDGKKQEDDSQQKAEENPSQNESGQQDGRNKGEKGSGSSDEKPLEQEGEEETNRNPDNGKRLEQQRYDNILKALENQEQNTQRRLMMGKSKAKLRRNQKDW